WRQSPAIGAILDRNPGDLADVLDEAAAFELGRTTWQLSWLFPMRLAELRSFASAVAPTHHDPDDDPEAPPRYEVLDPGRPTGPSIVRRVLQDLDVELPRGRRGRRIRRRWWQQ